MTILLVHGGGDSSATWRHIAPRLAHLGEVVTPDLAGHGDGPPLPDHDGGPLDLHTPLLDVIGDDPLVYVGHSLGGPVVVALAQLRPPRAGIVLVDAAPTLRTLDAASPEPFDPVAHEQRMRAIGFGAPGRRPTLEDAVRLAVLGRHPENPYTRLELFTDVPVRTVALTATRGPSAEVRDRLDALLPRLPNVEHHWIDSDHNLHEQHPDDVVAAVEEVVATAAGRR